MLVFLAEGFDIDRAEMVYLCASAADKHLNEGWSCRGLTDNKA